jgi:hypothetical protein
MTAHPTPLELLTILAGPVGPLGTEAERERLRRQLLAGDPLAAAERVLDALKAPSPADAGTSREGIEGEASDLLADLADSEGVAFRLTKSLDNPATRAAVLDALALNPRADALAPLASVVEAAGYDDWSERELIKLASALGSQGKAARPAVLLLQEAREWPPAVERELAIAFVATNEAD